MKIEDGYIKIHIDDDLINAPGILEACAKHATFNRYLINGLIQVMLTDEAEWDPDDGPWWTTVSFGRSYFEEARMKLINHIDQAAQTQVEKFQKERDVFEKYYHEYLSKSIYQQNTIVELRNQIRIMEIERAEDD